MQTPRSLCAFTLVELLIVIAIVAVLLALIFPAIRGTLAAARSFRCQSSQRTIAFDFTVFADDQLHGDRGNDGVELRNRALFRAETFQNSQYGTNEFWTYGENVPTHTVPDTQGRDPMRCAEVDGNIKLTRALSCSIGGVAPSKNVSYGLNIRLHWSEKRAAAGLSYGVVLSNRILDGYGIVPPSSLPLMMDVDGAAAAVRGTNPVFVGPSLDSTTLFADNRFWFPGVRHNGTMNVAFMDGHVKATHRPLLEGWAWGFEPPLPPRARP